MVRAGQISQNVELCGLPGRTVDGPRVGPVGFDHAASDWVVDLADDCALDDLPGVLALAVSAPLGVHSVLDAVHVEERGDGPEERDGQLHEHSPEAQEVPETEDPPERPVLAEGWLAAALPPRRSSSRRPPEGVVPSLSLGWKINAFDIPGDTSDKCLVVHTRQALYFLGKLSKT